MTLREETRFWSLICSTWEYDERIELSNTAAEIFASLDKDYECRSEAT